MVSIWFEDGVVGLSSSSSSSFETLVSLKFLTRRFTRDRLLNYIPVIYCCKVRHAFQAVPHFIPETDATHHHETNILPREPNNERTTSARTLNICLQSQSGQLLMVDSQEISSRSLSNSKRRYILFAMKLRLWRRFMVRVKVRNRVEKITESTVISPQFLSKIMVNT